jgi:hypothetical protein
MDGKTGWGWMEESVPTVSVDTADLSVLSSSSFFAKYPPVYLECHIRTT